MARPRRVIHTQGVSESPTIFVLFGATGDLARRMVLPAFYTLAQKGMLPREWRLIGNGRGDVAHLDFRKHVKDVLEEFGPKPEGDTWEEFQKRLLFAGGGFDTSHPGSLLDVLRDTHDELDQDPETDADDPQFVHYLAIPPSAFEETTKALGRHGLAKGSRIVYEKPYGNDLESFKKLDETVRGVFDESQVFRIDHFLGKEATQNLHVLRFANRQYAGVWSREHVAAVQIDVPETLDVADRAAFYDATGAVRDMLVTHLFQVAAEVAMEPPASMGADDLQSAREAAIACFRPLDPSEVVLGQFTGYLEIDGIDDSSKTDTFAAARLWIDSDRWRDVPFLLRTGKKMASSAQRVSLIMRPVDKTPLADVPAGCNAITFSLAGSGEFEAGLVVKEPGPGLQLAVGTGKLLFEDVTGPDPLPPYVALLNDVLEGDRSLFTSSEGLLHAWTAGQPLLDDLPDPLPYEPGSWGPAEAAKLAAPAKWLLR
jgi:glucose-6-phosphate 1-dehydrogenase